MIDWSRRLIVSDDWLIQMIAWFNWLFQMIDWFRWLIDSIDWFNWLIQLIDSIDWFNWLIQMIDLSRWFRLMRWLHHKLRPSIVRRAVPITRYGAQIWAVAAGSGVALVGRGEGWVWSRPLRGYSAPRGRTPRPRTPGDCGRNCIGRHPVGNQSWWGPGSDIPRPYTDQREAHRSRRDGG